MTHTFHFSQSLCWLSTWVLLLSEMYKTEFAFELNSWIKMQQSGICSQPHLTSVRSFNLQLFLNILLRYHNCVRYQVVCIQDNYRLFRPLRDWLWSLVFQLQLCQTTYNLLLLYIFLTLAKLTKTQSNYESFFLLLHFNCVHWWTF